MSIRPMILPDGWYPHATGELRARLEAWGRVDEAASVSGAMAAIVPHAGWTYSGRIAWAAWRSAADVDSIAIIGGHLPAGSDFRCFAEDGFDTPLGVIDADSDLRDYITAHLSVIPDTVADNTIEVHLPMVAFAFPGKPILCCRAPNDPSAASLGSCIAEYAKYSGRTVFVVGSTDLTHYGRPYGFTPGGPGPMGFNWARRADKAITEAFLSMDEAASLMHAESESSACSVGAAIAAIRYAKSIGATRSRLLMRGSSDEMSPGGDASVGYSSIAFMHDL